MTASIAAPGTQTGGSARIDHRLIVALLTLAGVCYAAMGLMWDHHPPDMSALYMAGRLWAEGMPGLIYASPDGFFGGTPPAWMALAAEWGMGGEEVLAYIYPPLWAAVLSPLAGALEPQAFFRVMAAAHTAMAAASVWIGWRMARSFAMPLWAWIVAGALLLFTSVAFYIAAMLLQPQIAVVFLCLLAFERLGAGRSGQAGALLALAATLKLAPAGLALVFVMERNWRALGVFAAVSAGIGVIGLAVAGWDLHMAYLAALSVAGDGLYVNSVNFSAEVPMQGIGILLGLLPEADLAARNLRLLGTPAAIEWLGKVALVLGAVWVWRASAPLDAARRLVARVFLVSLLINLFGPLGWAHYFLLQMLLLPALVGLLPARRGAAVMLAIAVAASWPFVLLLAMLVPGDFFRAAFGSLAMLALFGLVSSGLGRTAQGPQAGAESGRSGGPGCVSV